MKYFAVLLATIIATLFAVAQGNCLKEWTEWNGNCYRYMGQYPENWDTASDKCNTESPRRGNGHLVTIDSEEENEFLRIWWINMLNPLEGEKWMYFWTGLNDVKEEGKFVWEDGSPVTYTNWGGKQPDNRCNNSNCVTMTVRETTDLGKWDDARCDRSRAYVCEYTCHNCGKSKVEENT